MVDGGDRKGVVRPGTIRLSVEAAAAAYRLHGFGCCNQKQQQQQQNRRHTALAIDQGGQLERRPPAGTGETARAIAKTR